jgi:hypothetical protein
MAFTVFVTAPTMESTGVDRLRVAGGKVLFLKAPERFES